MGCTRSKFSGELVVEPQTSHTVQIEDERESDSGGSEEFNDVDFDVLEREVEAVQGLSHVANAAHSQLYLKHRKHRGGCWNLTHGRLQKVLQTPPQEFWGTPIDDSTQITHSDEFARVFGDVIGQAKSWVDFASLGPPDGKFLDEIARGLKALHLRDSHITVRLMTGNIIGMPTDNFRLLKALVKHPTHGIPPTSKLQIWVGSWRKGLTWNHAKILAVDGIHLVQGGHNVWDAHYLQQDPVRDVSARYEGQVAVDGHIFLNRLWAFLSSGVRARRARSGAVAFVPRFSNKNVAVVNWPEHSAPKYPPAFKRVTDPMSPAGAALIGDVPMLTIGRYGAVHRQPQFGNPADTAIVAAIDSAQHCIKMSLQDLGPVAIPTPAGAQCLPGMRWPRDGHPGYLDALARAIVHRDVAVTIAVSAPNCVPRQLSQFEANYGNGWSWKDLSAEIVGAMKRAVNFKAGKVASRTPKELAELVRRRLKVFYVRSRGGKHDWARKLLRGEGVGNHAKVFIVDDCCHYIGSQNLYIADLAEWGVLVDCPLATATLLREYWDPLWASSCTNQEEINADELLEEANKDRAQLKEDGMSEAMSATALAVRKANRLGGSNNQLLVWLMTGRHLLDTDTFGKSDPYVVLAVVDAHGKRVSITYTSRAIKEAGPSPLWNEQFVFEGLEKPEELFLRLRVWDRDTFLGIDALSKDDRLGDALVPLCDVAKNDRFQERLVVVNLNGHGGERSVVRLALNPHNGWGECGEQE